MQVKSQILVEPELSAWRQFLSRSTLWLGIWLLGAGVICGIAANWESLSRTQRFAGAQGLLALCALGAAWLGWRLRAAQGPQRYGPQALLALAGLLLGGLLALLGQTYQTGADNWELFAWWALLLTPWAVVAMSQAVWLLWMTVVNIAVLLYTQQANVFWWLSAATESAVLLAVLNLLFLAAWECAARRWHASTVLGPRVLLAWIIGVQVVTLCFDSASMYGLGSGLALLWIATTVGLGVYYRHGRVDLVALAMLAAGVIAISLRVVGEWGLDIAGDAWIALPLAALLIAEAVLTAGWLRRVADLSRAERHTQIRPPSGPDVQSAAREPSPAAGIASDPVSVPREVAPGRAAVKRPDAQPWYVHALLAFSAWLATLLLLLFFVASEVVSSSQGAVVAGVLLSVVGVVGLRTSTGLFWRQSVTAIAFAGQLMVLIGLLYPGDEVGLHAGTWLYVLALGAAVYALGPDTLSRFLSAGMMALALGALVVQRLVPGVMEYEWLFEWLGDDAVSATFVWLPVAVLGAWTAATAFYLGYFPPSAPQAPASPSAVAAESRNDVSAGRIPALRPFAWAFALAVQAMVWLAGGLSLGELPTLWRADPITTLTAAAGVLLPAACAVALLWPRRQGLTTGLMWGVPLGLLGLAVFWLPSPGVAFALAWMLLGFGLRDRRLMVLGGASLLVYLVTYYYQLQIPLLDKALWLGGAALLLFALRALVYLIPRWMRTITIPAPSTPAPVSAALRWRTAGVLGGLLIALSVVNYTIWQREALLSYGRIVILELAPVDPRSLMQGDYMALNFAVGEALRPRFGEQAYGQPVDGYVVLLPDGNGVARQVRIQRDAQPLTGEEVALRYRVRNHDVRIVTNAYFFPEGKADHYATARYGEVRVGDDGTGLLVRMLGEDGKPL